MPTERQNLRAVIALLLVSRAAFADCPTGQTPASCALHDEGVAAFTAGKYDEAATKFRAAIAAGPTARSYLGYSQSVEGQGKIALAYETMLVAQKFSKEEMATRASDPDVVGRSERIKYKLAELGGKISYVWLRLPDGVPPTRIVSVYREGEGDLVSPLGRWIVVAPEKQTMFATLDDGSRVQMAANIAPGSQGTVVIPVPVPVTKPVTQPPTVQQPPFVQQPPPVVEAPAEKPSPNPPNRVLGVDAAFIFRDAERIGFGLGFGAQYEHELNARVAIVGRGALVYHPSHDETISALETSTVSARSSLLVVGARTRAKAPIYASAELGALFLQRQETIATTGGVDRSDEYRHTYPAMLVGGGIRLGKVHLEVDGLLCINNGDYDMPFRWFATFGIDLYRR